MGTGDNTEKISRFKEAFCHALACGTIVNITASSFRTGEVKKIKGTPKSISGKSIIQLEYQLTEGRVKHKNSQLDEAGGVVDEMLSLGAKNVQLVCCDSTATLLVSNKGAVNTSFKSLAAHPSVIRFPVGNDREKNYLFSGDESFLIELGISDKNGRVHDKRQSKFRQINRFAEQVRDIMKHLPEDGTIYVYDMCCGKSYLSFAVYSYLADKLSRDVRMYCVDLKASVIEFCASVAAKLSYDGMVFSCADITTYTPGTRVDLVISLHACDTATDMVLDFAVKSGAKVILSTPCCQHEMMRIMDCPQLEFISKYSILKQKIASCATDALRLAKLEASGYKTDAIELIDPEETPKNVLIRGIRRRNFNIESKEAKQLCEYYNRSYSFMTGKDNIYE
ncbi:MAG: SAM-dependent methyltransferase [Clostridia bacterium]|nr:SAM-dependent methyltransferase [Clostridia bacterium]